MSSHLLQEFSGGKNLSHTYSKSHKFSCVTYFCTFFHKTGSNEFLFVFSTKMKKPKTQATSTIFEVASSMYEVASSMYKHQTILPLLTWYQIVEIFLIVYVFVRNLMSIFGKV